MNPSPCLPLETHEPVNALHVVGIRPKRVEAIVRSGRDVSVVANEAAAEKITSIDWLSCNRVGHTRGQVRHHVIQPSIVDKRPQSRAVVSAQAG